ncbi:MAG: hypothetical protein ACOYJF_11395 [Prevotella sp.]|jgi:hypothetical protein
MQTQEYHLRDPLSGVGSTLRHNEENPNRHLTWHFVTCLGLGLFLKGLLE